MTSNTKEYVIDLHGQSRKQIAQLGFDTLFTRAFRLLQVYPLNSPFIYVFLHRHPNSEELL
jgi:hypothetical protein